MGEPVVIFQNYYTPYRHALFEDIGRRGTDLIVCYAQKPSDEGRKWKQTSAPTSYRSVDCFRFLIGPFVFFWVPREISIAHRIVLLDNNPTNLCMIAWAIVFKLKRKQMRLWLQHIPDRFKGKLKLAFQRSCSRILIKLSERVIVFSEMTEQYLRSIDENVPSDKVRYCVPYDHQPGPAHSRWHSKVRRFGYLGVNTARKNVSALIEAFMRLNDPGAELHIGGFEPPLEVRDRDPRVHWWGYVEGVERERFYKSIDVLVLPSFSDPWGLVVNEAMHRGCLAGVSTECGSSEMIRQLSPAFVFTPHEAGISTFLSTCLALSPIERNNLQLKAVELIQNYSIPGTSKIWHDLLNA